MIYSEICKYFARLKFLKSNKQEESAITNIVNRLMFANPDISFKYIIDGKIIYNTVTKGLKDKIHTIYGKAFIENLIEINVKTDKYEVNGYISLPTFCKANKTYQTLIVNGRYVANSLISTAISNAYENFLMKGKFPIFILNFKLNYDDIDVNVHPSKMEVKFKNTREIFSLFYSSILEKLNEQNCSINYDLNDNAKNSFLLVEKSNNDENFIKPDSQLKKIEGGFSFSSFNNFNNELNNLNVEVPKYKNDEFSVLKSPDSLKPENNLDFEEKLKISNEHEKLAIVNMNQNLFDLHVNEYLLDTATIIRVEDGKVIR